MFCFEKYIFLMQDFRSTNCSRKIRLKIIQYFLNKCFVSSRRKTNNFCPLLKNKKKRYILSQHSGLSNKYYTKVFIKLLHTLFIRLIYTSYIIYICIHQTLIYTLYMSYLIRVICVNHIIYVYIQFASYMSYTRHIPLIHMSYMHDHNLFIYVHKMSHSHL